MSEWPVCTLENLTLLLTAILENLLAPHMSCRCSKINIIKISVTQKIKHKGIIIENTE